jgi:hypothetical protein
LWEDQKICKSVAFVITYSKPDSFGRAVSILMAEHIRVIVEIDSSRPTQQSASTLMISMPHLPISPKNAHAALSILTTAAESAAETPSL